MKLSKEIILKEGAFALIEQLLQKSKMLLEDENFLNRYRKGVYAQVTLDGTALQKMQKYLKGVGIDMLPLNKAHITVIYSRSRPQSEPKAWDINGSVQPKSFGLFGKGSKDEPYVLALEVTSPELTQANLKYRKDYRLKPTYPDYKPHLTLTYDINRILPGLKKMQEKQKKTIINIFNKMIPELPKNIRIQKHTVEPLDEKWT